MLVNEFGGTDKAGEALKSVTDGMKAETELTAVGLTHFREVNGELMGVTKYLV